MKSIFEPKYYETPVSVMFLKDFDKKETWYFGVAYQDGIICGRDQDIESGIISIKTVFDNWNKWKEMGKISHIDSPIVEQE